MEQPAESLWLARLRWRIRGAWQWPAFAVLTLLDALLLIELPFYDDGPGNLLAGVLLAGFANLFCVAVLARAVGVRLRRRRPDLPLVVARDYAGTALLCATTLVLVAAGMAHRPALTRERDDLQAAIASVHDYVVTQAPAYRAGLAGVDAMRVDADLYRTCVPGPDPRRWLCLFVTTDQRPAGVTLDPDRAPNTVYRRHGGFG